ncbi:hypothetical protein AB0D94_22280 [Streptomyces sp. NPDC048255]|uniref:hypothetical protein n=1 Tax=Streptomyces sp. NPDC048255 TaxID=3154713 RepID=UPI0033FF2965
MSPHPSPDPPAGTHACDTDPRTWSDIFSTTIDAVPIDCVRPNDTDRPVWSLCSPRCCRPEDYLGTLHARNTGALWHVQTTGELHTSFADAVRALCRQPGHSTSKNGRCSAQCVGDAAGKGADQFVEVSHRLPSGELHSRGEADGAGPG